MTMPVKYFVPKVNVKLYIIDFPLEITVVKIMKLQSECLLRPRLFIPQFLVEVYLT